LRSISALESRPDNCSFDKNDQNLKGKTPKTFKKNLFGTSKRFYQDGPKPDPKAKYQKLRNEL